MNQSRIPLGQTEPKRGNNTLLLEFMINTKRAKPPQKFQKVTILKKSPYKFYHFKVIFTILQIYRIVRILNIAHPRGTLIQIEQRKKVDQPERLINQAWSGFDLNIFKKNFYVFVKIVCRLRSIIHPEDKSQLVEIEIIGRIGDDQLGSVSVFG